MREPVDKKQQRGESVGLGRDVREAGNGGEVAGKSRLEDLLEPHEAGQVAAPLGGEKWKRERRSDVAFCRFRCQSSGLHVNNDLEMSNLKDLFQM